jgi:transcriptional regulator with XRE-family HTH domain
MRRVSIMATNPFKFTLRAVRISCGYTALEAAKACGISEGTMNRYEIDSGTISFETARKLAKLYGISFEAFYIGKEKDCIQHNRARAEHRAVRIEHSEAFAAGRGQLCNS